jgi:hypothetical protein
MNKSVGSQVIKYLLNIRMKCFDTLFPDCVDMLKLSFGLDLKLNFCYS